MYALSARSGRILWRTPLHQLLESSPVVWGGKVFTGGGSNDVRALDAVTGKILLTFHATGSVPGSPSIDPANGRLFVGDYAGKMYCCGPPTAISSGQADGGLSSGLRSGTFYLAGGRLRPGVHREHGRQDLSFVEDTGDVADVHAA
jgi:hypothetical protein